MRLNVDAVTYLLPVMAIASTVPRLPRIFARFAFLPVGKPVVVPIPKGLAARLPTAAVTYRSAPVLTLADLPGEAKVTSDPFAIRFFPDLGYITARPRGAFIAKGNSATLVRVDSTITADALVLRARHLPDWIWYPPVFLLMVMDSSLWRSLVFIAIGLAGIALGIVFGQITAKRALDAIAGEVAKRVEELAGR